MKPVVEQAGDILGYDGCLNFFAGPTNTQFKAEFNFYNVHYLYTHLVGTSGGNTDDMREAIEMMNAGKIDPAAMVTHIGGLNAVVDTVLNLPQIPGGKKLIYNQIDLPLTAIDDFEGEGPDRSPLCPGWTSSARPATACGTARRRNISWPTPRPSKKSGTGKGGSI